MFQRLYLGGRSCLSTVLVFELRLTGCAQRRLGGIAKGKKYIQASNLGFSRSQHRDIAQIDMNMPTPQKIQPTRVNARSAGGTSCAVACAIIRGAN
jgi:hypothetical protein